MNNNWATNRYGSGGGIDIGSPPHNCTLYAAWMLAQNGLADPGRSWGNAKEWGNALASVTNTTPAVGSIAWFPNIGDKGHVAYVAQVNTANNTVFLESDNYTGGSGGYTSSGWVAASDASGYIHLQDVTSSERPTGDYNGDNKTDFAVYNPTNGLWYTNSLGTVGPFGGPGQIPVPGDYNGDGKTDFAVYNPTNGLWYTNSLGTVGPFGGPGQIPVPGDYNGDGKTDFAVYNPTNGLWYTNSLGTVGPFGGPGQIPVPGDYNGDGKTDFAVYNPTNGLWYTNSLGTVGPFGGPGQMSVTSFVGVLASSYMTIAAPTAVQATGGDGSAVVSWQAPPDDGLRQLDGYIVTPYIGSTPQTPVTTSSMATTRSMTGLSNGVTYTFRVAARTVVGTGPWSAASNTVIPTPPATTPDAPTLTTAAADNGNARVTWTAPASNGGSAVTGYVVTPYVGFTAQAARTFNSTATSQTISGLTNGVTYTFKVAAKNAVGTGPQSAASNAVKPSGTWFLRNANSAGGSIGGFNYGSPGDVAVSGDWDGNGTTTVGVYRPSTSTWFLRNANSAGGSIGGFTFGNPGDIPVVGDWDGNGTTTIGAYRPSNGTWYLRNSNSAGGSIGGFKYTITGATPVTGDWDGNNTTTIGLFNASNATWYLRNANTAATPSGGFTYGSAGDQPVTGNWDGTGGDTIGLYRPTTSSWYLRNANSSGGSIGGFTFGNPGDQPVTGNWDAAAGDTVGVLR